MEVSQFREKLNKVDGNVYVIEEMAQLTSGSYEAELIHDNVNVSTLSVYTGPKLTGDRIQSYVISTSSMTPWKRVIRIYADVPRVYISYETDGDTVEAEDINKLQEAVIITQKAVNSETVRAKSVEESLADNIQSEIDRSTAAEGQLNNRIDTERARAEAAEQANSSVISTEVNRAKSKETELQNSLQTEVGRAEAAEASIRSTIETNRPIWNDKYTRNEIDNKFSAMETAIDWKEAVDTYADIVTAYPNPEDGWTVNVKDTDYTYRWSGTEWVAISANAIPKATQSVDGLLSKEDKAAYDDTYAKRHTHTNKSVIDKITQTLLDHWTDAYNKRHEHGNKAILDMLTQGVIDNWNGAYTHISDAVKHITSVERESWNTVANKVDKVSGKQLSTNDYTTADKNKLAGIAAGAEVNVQSDWNVVDEKSDAYIKNKPVAMPASDVLAWAKAANKPSYSWTEITGKPGTFTPAAHTHTKNQITDMPSKVSQFINDSGYITAADVDTSQSHTHSNKTVLDKLTQAMLDKLGGIAEGANKYIHPTNAGNKHIPSGGASGQFLKWSADGTAVWAEDNNTTYTAFKAASASAAGGTGLVPAPAAGAQAKYLRGDGSWQTPPDTKYTHPNSGAAAGTYRSVTVNTQGHVTGGTLQGGFTWAQLKDAYTWGDLKGE